MSEKTVVDTTIKIPSFKDIQKQYSDQQESNTKRDLEIKQAAVELKKSLKGSGVESVTISVGDRSSTIPVGGSMFPSQEAQDEIDAMDNPSGETTKRKRGRPRKNKAVDDGGNTGVVTDDSLKTELKDLVKCLKPFRGSAKKDQNGLGLTVIPNRNGEGSTAFIYASNGTIGAIAYTNEETTLEDLAKYSIVNSITEEAAKVLLMPPEAELLIPIHLSIDDARLDCPEGSSEYTIVFNTDFPGYDLPTVELTLTQYQAWTEACAYKEIDAYAFKVADNKYLYYRETTWGGWAVICNYRAGGVPVEYPDPSANAYTGPGSDLANPPAE